MPIDTVHREYSEFEPKWSKARDVLAGPDTIKAKNEIYLPRLSGQTDVEYIAYRDRTPFWNATARTHDGLVGMLFRKDPVVNLPEEGQAGTALQNLWADTDLKGNSLEAYARNIASDVLGIGRAGTLIDWSEEEEQPFFAFFQAENILNWRTERIGGVIKLSLLVLREWICLPSHIQLAQGETSDNIDKENDPYSDTEIEQLRVLRLVPMNDAQADEETPAAGMKYIVELWRKENYKKGNKTTTRWKLEEIKEPTRRGRQMEFIPFVFHGSDDGDATVDRPPLDDLIEMNLDHYRTSADYKHGMHFTALPTAWVAGFSSSTTLKIGSSEAWVSENPEARAGYLEFEGKGLDEFSKYLEALERKMAVLGARLLEQQKKEAETAEAMSIRQGGEVSVLQHISRVISTTLSKALKIASWWTGTGDAPETIDDDGASIQLNSDFLTSKLNSQDVVNLISAWMQGGISRDTLYWNLSQGEILPPGRTPEEEIELLEIEGKLGQETPMPGDEEEEDEDEPPPTNEEEEDEPEA